MGRFGTVDDLVIDIGYVYNVLDFVPLVLQVANYDIERDVGSGMTYVTIVIDGRSTDIDIDLVSVERLEGLQPPCQGVVDLNG